MPLARKASENELRLQVVSIVDGKRVNLGGLADQIRAARTEDQAGGFAASVPAIEGGRDFSGGRRVECLAERIREAKERLARGRARVTMPYRLA